MTPLVAHLRGHDPGWTVMVPIGIVFAATSTVLARTLRDITINATSETENAR